MTLTGDFSFLGVLDGASERSAWLKEGTPTMAMARTVSAKRERIDRRFIFILQDVW
jgi:hypothetical protein